MLSNVGLSRPVRRIFSVCALCTVGVMLASCAPPPGKPVVVNRPSAPKAAPPVVPSTPGGPQTTTGPNLGPVPPSLPSLEALLGSLPHSVDGQVSEPPLIPTAKGMRVAVLLPLSGPNQGIGAALLNASEMAMFDFADAGFEMLVQDTRGTPEGAAEAARLAVADGATMIVGPLLATSVRAVSDTARAADVPVVAFSSDRTVAGDGIYTMGFFPGDEVRRVMEYAASKGAKRFALLAPRGPYGDAVLNAMQAATFGLGAVVTHAQFYDPQASDFSQPVKTIANYEERRQALENQRRILEARGDEVSTLALKRLENLQTLGDAPFDALLVADGGKRLVAVAAMLPFYDIDPKKVKILGTGQWDEEGLGAEPALAGGWYAAPDPASRRAFSKEYLDDFGNRPHRLATLAYDATALAVVLGTQGSDRPYANTALTQPGGFAGRDGIFRFKSDGAAERGLAVLEVDRRGSTVISPAPKTFPTY